MSRAARQHHEGEGSDNDLVFEEVGTSNVDVGGGRGTEEEDDEDEDEEAWDEVEVGTVEQPSNEGGIEIVLQKEPEQARVKDRRQKKGTGVNQAYERMIRHERHKLHVICLLVSGMIRNRWISDPTLQARLLSIVPMRIQNSFSVITKANYPNERDRARLFDGALKELVAWWYDYFESDQTKSLVRRTAQDVEEELANGWNVQDYVDVGNGDATDEAPSPAKGKAKKRKVKQKDFASTEATGEVLRSANSLAKRAVSTRTGSKDVMAQLFTAICRALDIPARLVFSLQPVDWRAPSATAKASSSRASSSKAATSESDTSVKRKRKSGAASTDDSGASSWEDDRRKVNYTVPAVRLRRSKPAKRKEDSVDPAGSIPVWWTEVYEKMNRQWIAVDSVRRLTRCKNAMAPSKASADNQLLYVVAYEEDDSVRDVTPRYATAFSTATLKARVPSKKGTNFFADLLRPYERKFQLNRDREEHEELWNRQAHEPMPTSMAGFKNHPTYVLEKDLKREEAIRPGSKRLGTFKGEEAVYARSSVVQLKSAENWWRIGRVVKDDNEIPMKWVKQRNVTINKRREEEARRYEGQEPSQQPLYAEEQTKLFKPPPIGPDGKVPKNSFGNVDLFVPSMLPDGAAHVPHKGSAKVAKELGIDYAEAITGFEFRQRRAIPVISGIVVARDAAEVVEEAVLARAHADFEKEQEKQRERVLKRWKKLIQGLRIRQRLQASYDAGDHSVLLREGASQLVQPSSSSAKGKKRASEPVTTPTPKKKKVKQEPDEDLPPKKSTSGRSLRFTMSTEERALAKEMAIKKK